MTALICAIALTIIPAPADCQRGGHALAIPPRGGHALVVLDPVGDVAAWTCIHQREGAWTADTGNGYHGGLQMDVGFMTTYGSDMRARYDGWAEVWSPRDQMVVAERARSSGRGYYPWPNTARACRLI